MGYGGPGVFWGAGGFYKAAGVGYDPSVNAVWLDASDLDTMYEERTGASATTPSSVDGVVGSWLNKGTLGGWATCAADSNRPILRTGGGLYWLEFDGTTDYFALAAAITLGDDMTVVRGIGRAAAGTHSIGLGNTTRYDAWWYTDNVIYVQSGATTTDSAASTATGDFVLTTVRDVTTELTRSNAVQVASGAAPAVSGAYVDIGQAGSTFNAGKLYGLIYDPTAISGSSLTEIEEYMAGKMGLDFTFDPSTMAYWFDPSDLDTLFQERTGAAATTPAVVDGVVGSMQNKGTAGGWVTAPTDAARPILRQIGDLYYLELDGTDDSFTVSPAIDLVENMTSIFAADRLVGDETFNLARSDSFSYYDLYWAGADDKLYLELGDTGYSFVYGDTAGKYVMTGMRDGSTELSRINGVQTGTRAAPALTEGGNLDVFFEQNGFYGNSNWYGCVLDTTTLSASDLRAAEAYIASKLWG